MRDHSLVGKRFKQLDLRRGKRARFGATCSESSNEFLLQAKGNGQESAPTADIRDP